MRPFVIPVVASLVVACVACREAESSGPAPVLSAAGPRALQLYGAGSKEGLGTACEAPGYRQFDFWIGYWGVRNALNPNPVGPGGRDIVERELDGCIIEENWQGVARSINTWDPGTRTYHQQYLDVTGWHLAMDGGLQPDGSMKLTEYADVACPQCPGGVRRVRSDWVFRALTPDSIQQVQLRFDDRTGQQLPTFWDGRFRRLAPFTLPPTPATGACSSDPSSRQFDFAVGEWVIRQGNAHGTDGASGGSTSATVTRELAGCLIEERIDGPGGYAAWSFAGWHATDQVWVRTYVDNLGGRTFLRGTLDGDRLVMTGHRSLADGTLTKVRVTFAPEGTDRIVERWEIAGAGDSYERAGEVVRIRKN